MEGLRKCLPPSWRSHTNQRVTTPRWYVELVGALVVKDRKHTGQTPELELILRW
jgi:hypothetical protein